jgi:uncharacterized protein
VKKRTRLTVGALLALLAGGAMYVLHLKLPRPASASDCQGYAACDKACSAKNECACGSLGGLLLHGSTVARDKARGLSLLNRACDQGCATACWALGSAYQGGAGVRADTDRAKAIFDRLNAMCQEGCEANDADKCFTLAGSYLSGHGVTADRNMAEHFYARAADLYEQQCASEEAHGCARLALLTDHGLGVQASKTKARPLYEKACAKGDLESCEEAAKLYDGRDKELPRDDDRAKELARLACRGGRPTGCAIANDSEAFMAIEEAACSAGGRFECGSAAFALSTGAHGVVRDLGRAAPLAQRMLTLEEKDCADDDGSACAALARPYESGSIEGEEAGTFIQKDGARAAALRDRACQLGFESACPRRGDAHGAPN